LCGSYILSPYKQPPVECTVFAPPVLCLINSARRKRQLPQHHSQQVCLTFRQQLQRLQTQTHFLLGQALHGHKYLRIQFCSHPKLQVMPQYLGSSSSQNQSSISSNGSMSVVYLCQSKQVLTIEAEHEVKRTSRHGSAE
jgi:hypothetical protein